MGRANAKPRTRAANGMYGPAGGHPDGSESSHSPGPSPAERRSGALSTASQPWKQKQPPAICIRSKAARYCLLLGPLVVWVLAIAAGVYMCDVQMGAAVKAPRVTHPLLWFDRWVSIGISPQVSCTPDVSCVRLVFSSSMNPVKQGQ